MNFDRSKRLFEEGQKNLVGAVNSPVRAYKSVGGTPLFIKKAKGSKIIDVDNNQYIDLVLSYGPMILGHRPKKIEKSIVKALKNGYTFGATSAGEIELAKIICDAFPGMDKVRFVNSGTEAVLSALRLARAFTNKNKIIKFSGCYHGHTDALLVAAGSGLATLSLPGSSGVPKEAVQNTLIAEYNNIEKVKNHLIEHGFGHLEVKAFDAAEPPYKISVKEDISQAIIKAAEEVFGEKPVVNGVSAEGTILKHVWIPCVLTGFANPGANLHAPDENIHVENYIKGIKYAAAIMENFSKE